MKPQTRNPALDILRAALDTVRLPFARFSATPSAARAFLHRFGRTIAEPGQAVERARFDSGKWTLELLKHLEWRRFEELCAAYFEALGFTIGVTRTRADGGADILLGAAGSDSALTVVHCKAWSAYRVGIKPVRELRAAMTSAGAGEGMLVTSGRFTQEAVDAAPKEYVTLIDGADLLGKLGALPLEQARTLLKLATQGDFLTPTCPACSVKMVSRQSTAHGKRFWGCPNYPQCKETVFGTVGG
jgi:restriction system protein